MDKFLALVSSLPKDQQEIFYKYMGVYLACRQDVDEKIDFLESHKIKLDTARALVRVFSMDIKDIRVRYNLYKEAVLEDIVIMYPEILRYDPKKVISRIKACEKIGKAFLVNGKPADYLFDDQQWMMVKNAIIGDKMDFNRSVDSIRPDKVVEPLPDPEDYITDDNYDLDVVAFERYEKLSKLLENVRFTIGSTAINSPSVLSSDEFLMREIGHNPTASDKDIIKNCLKTCDGITEGVDEIIDELMALEENKGEKRGL